MPAAPAAVGPFCVAEDGSGGAHEQGVQDVVVGQVVRCEDVDKRSRGENDPGVDLVVAEGAGDAWDAQEGSDQEQTDEQDGPFTRIMC